MAISDPVAVYNARDNVDAHLVRNYLEQNGVEAFAAMDESPYGMWMFGLLPEIHKPQVWVDRSAIELAKPLLMKYEQRLRLQAAPATGSAEREGEWIQAVCEECGTTSVFGASKDGTVQDCPHCGAYMDVGDNAFEDFDS
jgi:hypothetical protein